VRRRAALPLAAAILAAVLFVALGVWQVERRAWKLDLIARVDARVHAAPVDPPAIWNAGVAREAEYRHVRVTGRFLHDRETLVRALTERGGGFWVLTPLRTAGSTILVNRGFVPPDRKAAASRPAGQVEGAVTVTGLLRLSEPGGAFLRSNDPAADRWYARDVAAIARARRVGRVAPYFIDAAASPSGGYPVGGLTVVSFRNTHLIYALTWFGLAVVSLVGAVAILRSERRG